MRALSTFLLQKGSIRFRWAPLPDEAFKSGRATSGPAAEVTHHERTWHRRLASVLRAHCIRFPREKKKKTTKRKSVAPFNQLATGGP